MPMKSIIISLLILILVPMSVNAVKFCDGDALVENISVNNVVVTISNIECDFGCVDETLSTLGSPGCIESDLVLWIILIVVVIILALIFKGINK